MWRRVTSHLHIGRPDSRTFLIATVFALSPKYLLSAPAKSTPHSPTLLIVPVNPPASLKLSTGNFVPFSSVLCLLQGASILYSFVWINYCKTEGPAVTIRTTSLTYNYSTFCPHSVFMCFVWIWEQAAIISLYSIDWLVFITETECVHCAVRSTFYVLPTQCIYAFCVDLRTKSDYFTVQH